MFKIKGILASAEGALRNLKPGDFELTDEGRAVIARIQEKQCLEKLKARKQGVKNDK